MRSSNTLRKPVCTPCRWGDSPLRWIECLIFLEMGEEVAHLNVHYTQDKMNSWKVPASWGLAGEQLAV